MRKNTMVKRVAITLMAALMVTGVFAGVKPVTVSANDGLGIYKEKDTITVKEMSQYAVITSDSANIREGISTSDRVLNTLEHGAVIRVTGATYRNGQKTEWYRVWTTDKKYGGQTAGYIHSSTFWFADESAAAEEAKKDDAKADYTVEKVSELRKVVSDVNVRKGPKATYDKMGALTKGQEVEVTGIVYKNGHKSNWVKVGFGETQGYVCADYLK